jgi:hypothetical protein
MNIFSMIRKNIGRRLETPVETVGLPTHVFLTETIRVMVNRDRCEYAGSAGRYAFQPGAKRSGAWLLENLTAGYFNR